MALTSRAPFNKNQFYSFWLGNVADAPPPPNVGFAAILEGPDGAVGIASSVTLTGFVSSLNKTSIGPQGRYNKFRSRLSDSLTQPLPPSGAAIAESYDIVVAFGFAPQPQKSSLDPRNLGPQLSNPFNVSQFKALRLAADSAPPGFDLGLAFPTEGYDIVVAVGSLSLSGSAAIIEGADSPASLGGITVTGFAAIIELNDIPGAFGVPVLSAAAAILEGFDGVGGFSVAGSTGFANILEGPDTGSAQGGLTITGIAAIVEGFDRPTGVGSQAISGFAAIIEPSDIVASVVTPIVTAFANITEGKDSGGGSGTTGLVSFAAIIEGFDGPTSAGGTTVTGFANIVEGQDVGLGSGNNSAGGIFGFATIVESSDVLNVVAGSIPSFFYRNAVIIAVSQSGVQGARSVFLEGSACIVTAAYFDTNGNPYVPSQVQYEINDLASGEQIVSLTPVPVGTTAEIVVSSQQNQMISLTRHWEAHQITFQITDGLGDIFYARTIFLIKRAPGLP